VQHKVLWMLAVLLGLSGGAALARSAEEQQNIDAVKRVKPSVVKIETGNRTSKNPGIGSGVVLRKDGFILTNYHVVKRAQRITVFLANQKKFSARVWKSSPERDIAILKIEAKELPVPRFGNSDKIELGQTAIAIGSPLRFSWSVTIGTVSAVGRDVQAMNTYYKNLIQTDAAINPGSSGGALINSNGEVIGINTLVYTGTQKYPHAQGLAFAIPINDALKVAQQLVSQQEVGPPVGAPAWFGVEVKEVSRDMAESYGWRIKSGLLVKSVTNPGPAATAGIKKSDVISEADGTQIRTVGDLKTVLGRHKSGDTIEVVVWALGQTRRTVKVTLEPPP